MEVHARHLHRYAGPIDCPLQTYAPEGEPLHSVVEEFADDQNAWLRDFLPVGWILLLKPNTFMLIQYFRLFRKWSKTRQMTWWRPRLVGGMLSVSTRNETILFVNR